MTEPLIAFDELRQSHLEQISLLFSNRPTLRSVAQAQVQRFLDTTYPQLKLLADQTYIGEPWITPREGARDYRYTSLTDAVLERFMGNTVTLYVDGYHVVGRQAVQDVSDDVVPGLADIETLVNQVGGLLLAHFKDQLVAYWNEPDLLKLPRWGAFSNDLMELMYDSRMPPGMTEQHFESIFPRRLLSPLRLGLDWTPQSAQLHIYGVQFTRRRATAQAFSEMAPVLILDHLLLGAEECTRLLFSPATGFYVLDTLDEVGAWLPGLAHLDGEEGHLEWQVTELWEDPFDVLARSFLERQLRAIENIDQSRIETLEDFEAVLDEMTDPANGFRSYLTPRQQRLQAKTPSWLADGLPADQQAYGRLLAELAVVQQTSGGQGFHDGIRLIKPYCADALRDKISADYPAAGRVDPDDIQLILDNVIGVALPTGGFAGTVEETCLTLTELALRNLGGLRYGRVQIRLKDQVSVPGWMTFDYLKRVVEHVNIGDTYPRLLQRTLIGDKAETSRRENLLYAQLQVQLPLLALQLKMQGKCGFTQASYQCVASALQLKTGARRAPEQSIVWRALAFVATPGHRPDKVAAMYVLGPRNIQQGPHVLYRPLFPDTLLAFDTRAQLLEAICVEGDLQSSVLAWIAPNRRAVYANGGFRTPHTVRQLQGDEFAAVGVPAAAQLDTVEVSGDIRHEVFLSTAQALVELADRSSISNVEERWETLKTGGWLLFGTLLPFVGGPMALVGWFVQAMASVVDDVTALAGTDAAARNAATVDLLTQLVFVLAHWTAPHSSELRPDLVHEIFARRPEPAVPGALVAHKVDAVTAPQRLGGWASPRYNLAPELQQRIHALSLEEPRDGWGEVVMTGPQRGLLRDARVYPAILHARVRERWYRVTLIGERVRVIADEGAAFGPWLVREVGGTWDFDCGLKLLAGNAADAQERTRESDEHWKGVFRQQLQQVKEQAPQRLLAVHKARDLLVKTQAPGLDNPFSDQHRQAARKRYADELEKRLALDIRELNLVRQLRQLRGITQPEQALCDALEAVILCLRLLHEHARYNTVLASDSLTAAHQRLEAAAQRGEMASILPQENLALTSGMRQLADINEQAISWRKTEHEALSELGQVPKYGRDRLQALLVNAPRQPSVLDLQALQMTNLWGLSRSEAGMSVANDLFASFEETIDRARWASTSHAALERLSGLLQEEKVEFHETLLHTYNEVEDRLAFWYASEAGYFNAEYVERLRALLSDLKTQARTSFAQLVGGQEEAPIAVPQAASSPVRKLIRTRKRGMYAVEIRPASAEQSSEIADLTNTFDSLITSFKQADDGIWDPVPVATPLERAQPSLNALLTLGTNLMTETDAAIANVSNMRQVNEPRSVQDILEQYADKLSQCATDINRVLTTPDYASRLDTRTARARTKVADILAKAALARERGLLARIAAIKARLPTETDIDFLHTHKAVDIWRKGGRVNISGKKNNDFLQVYVMTEPHSHDALWYGHFHYDKAQGFDDHFTAAHLKTREQERMGPRARIAAQEHAFSRMRTGQGGRVTQTLEVHYEKIHLALARKLFFPAPLWPE